MAGRHSGTYPYPTDPGLYSDIHGFRGGLLAVDRGVTHRLNKLRRRQDGIPLGFPIVFYESGYWWRSRYPSTYDRTLI